MVSIIVGWLLFVFTVWGSGFVALRPFSLLRTERMALGFVVGATLLPFLLFLINTITHLSVLGQGDGGFLFTVLLVIMIFLLLFIEVFSKRRKNAETHTATREGLISPFTNILRLVLWLSLVVFFYLVVQGVTKPIYGWDEFSYWLYAAKLLYLSGGASTALHHDLYSSYPLGFPYLVAWCYHFIEMASVSAAKWISPMITLASMIVMNRAMVRSGVRPVNALLGVALFAWGTYYMLFYNWVAFGEMIYVDTYGIATLYAALWLREKRTTDFMLAMLVLGLSTFLRVDGAYIAIFTLVILFISNWKSKQEISFKQGAVGLLVVAIPIAAWYLFRFAFHLDSGWTTRISIAVIMARLQPPVLPGLLGSMWATISNIGNYPIDLLLPLLIIALPFSKRRDVFFLAFVSVVQLIYLFVAYLTVFTTFEAMHASSLPRYMLRNDPLIAIAFTLLISGKSQWKGFRHKKKPATGTAVSHKGKKRVSEAAP